MMKNRFFIGSMLFAVLFAFSGAAALFAADNVLFKEDFSSFKSKTKPKKYTKGENMVLSEDGENFLRYTGTSFMDLISIRDFPEVREWNDIDLSFSIRPQEVPFNIYAVVKKQGKTQGQNYLWYYIQFLDKKVIATIHGLKDEVKADESKKRAEATLKKPLEAGKWYDIFINIRGNTIKVFIDYDGEMVKVLEFETVPGNGTVDFYKHGNATVDLKDIYIVKK